MDLSNLVGNSRTLSTGPSGYDERLAGVSSLNSLSQRRIPQGNKVNDGDIAKQRRLDAVQSLSNISASIQDYDQKQRARTRIPRHLMGTIYSNARWLTWGTPLPMHPIEWKIHSLFSRGIGVMLDPTSYPSRPIYEVASSSIGGSMILSAFVVHPSISTSVVPAGNLDEADVELSCVGEIVMDALPSSGYPRHIIRIDKFKRQVAGRFALRTVDATDLEGRPLEEISLKSETPSFVNLSSSCLIFHVSMAGKVWSCCPSLKTLKLMKSNCTHIARFEIINERLKVIPLVSGNDTHGKISVNGSLTIVGSPAMIHSIASAISDAVRFIVSNQSLCLDLLDTLKIRSTHGAMLKPSTSEIDSR